MDNIIEMKIFHMKNNIILKLIILKKKNFRNLIKIVVIWLNHYNSKDTMTLISQLMIYHKNDIINKIFQQLNQHHKDLA